MNVKPIITLLLVLFLWSCGGNGGTGITDGGGCDYPSWWQQDKSNSDVVYGYGRDSFENPAFAQGGSLGFAQSDAIEQINNEITKEYDIVANAILGQTLSDKDREFVQEQLAELHLNTNEACSFCVRTEMAECVDGGLMVVFSKVEVNVEEIIDSEMRAKMSDLLQKADGLIDK